MSVKYILGVILSLPFLPILYFQGQKIRSSIPKLPEAKDSKGCYNSKQANGELQLLTVGESTVAGVGVSTHAEGLTGALAEELSSRFHAQVSWSAYARSGYTIKQIRERLIPNISEDIVDLIVIGIGANDAFRLRSPSGWKNDLIDLITELRSRFSGTPLVFINMPPVKDFPAFTPLMKFIIGNLLEILGEELQTLANEYADVFYLNEKIRLHDWRNRSVTAMKVEDFFSDGVHPSKLTYQIWAKEIGRAIHEKKVLNKG